MDALKLTRFRRHPFVWRAWRLFRIVQNWVRWWAICSKRERHTSAALSAKLQISLRVFRELPSRIR